jgi:hypothetical protein
MQHNKMTVQQFLARVYRPDDGRVKPKHVVIRYMKDKNVAFKTVVTCMYKKQHCYTYSFTHHDRQRCCKHLLI